MGDEADIAHQRIGEDLLAALQIGFGESTADRRHVDIAAADLGEAHELQRFEHHDQIVGGDVLALGEMRQVGAAVEGLGDQQIEQADELLNRGIRQAVLHAQRVGAPAAASAFAARHGGEQRIDLVDDAAEGRRRPVARAAAAAPESRRGCSRGRCRK